MHRHANYTYSPSAPTNHRYSGTSSAFSASANPNEDWTKISDLAERRRIQNRIAQRNYRKKLKKRLEDLERKAASSSASPEQQPAELDTSSRPRKNEQTGSEVKSESSDFLASRQQSSEAGLQRYLAVHDDRSMFSQQFTRQLSTSPPPFAFSTYPSETLSYTTFSQHMPYAAMSSTCAEMPMYPHSQYLPPVSSPYVSNLSGMTYPAKPELFAEEEINPFNMSYASITGLDMSAAQSYTDSNPQTPPLSECFEQSSAGTPPESANLPTTPSIIPTTPTLALSDDLLSSLR